MSKARKTETPKRKERRYRMTYSLHPHPEGLTVDEVRTSKEGGGCDAVLLASLIYPEDGSFSCLFVGKDGRTGSNLQDVEWFKVWTLLASRLARSETLGPGHRQLAQACFDLVRDVMMVGPCSKPNCACNRPHAPVPDGTTKH